MAVVQIEAAEAVSPVSSTRSESPESFVFPPLPDQRHQGTQRYGPKHPHQSQNATSDSSSPPTSSTKDAVSPQTESRSPSPLRTHPPNIPHQLRRRYHHDHLPQASPAPTKPLPPIPRARTPEPPRPILKDTRQAFQRCILPALPPHLARAKPVRLAAALQRTTTTTTTSPSSSLSSSCSVATGQGSAWRAGRLRELDPCDFRSLYERDGTVHFWLDVEAVLANCPGPEALPPGHWAKMVRLAREVDACRCTTGCDCTQLVKGTCSVDETMAGKRHGDA